MVWMDAVGAGRTAWRPVGGGRDGAVDGRPRRWTTPSWRQLSTTGPRVVHGSGPVHPRPRNELSTELSPDVGEECAHGDAGRPIGHRRVVTRAVGNRWASPPAHEMKRTVTDPVTPLITWSERGAVSVVRRTTSGCVSWLRGRSCRGGGVSREGVDNPGGNGRRARAGSPDRGARPLHRIDVPARPRRRHRPRPGGVSGRR
jgi:hypothetical protein